jgi:N-acetylglucosamine kinase-like BadF-type ATPase
MAIGEDAMGKTTVVGGWGRLTGDEGSGYYIGREGICAALRAFDGVAPQTVLTHAAFAYFDVCAPRDLISAFYGETEPDVAGFSRCVAKCADEGDKVAENILLDAANYLVRYASVLIERTNANLLGVWGSVLCKNATVRRAFEDGVHQKFPNVEIREPAISAELAAALYAAKQEKGE